MTNLDYHARDPEQATCRYLEGDLCYCTDCERRACMACGEIMRAVEHEERDGLCHNCEVCKCGMFRESGKKCECGT